MLAPPDRKLAPGRLVPLDGDLETTARAYGMHPDTVGAFPAPAGQAYIPSADEVICHWAPDLATLDEARLGSNPAVLAAAFHRACGKVGLGYGVEGDAGWFWSPNPELDGASRKRREVVDGVAEHRIMWAPSFWRCSVFMNDVVWQAGWKPDVTPNRHYRLAGQVHTSKMFAEVPRADAMPGALFQKFGGAGSDESHNAVLTTGVTVTTTGETEQWSFRIVGAEHERARENPRSYEMKPGTNETTDGRVLRFFRPRFKR